MNTAGISTIVPKAMKRAANRRGFLTTTEERWIVQKLLELKPDARFKTSGVTGDMGGISRYEFLFEGNDIADLRPPHYRIGHFFCLPNELRREMGLPLATP